MIDKTIKSAGKRFVSLVNPKTNERISYAYPVSYGENNVSYEKGARECAVFLAALVKLKSDGLIPADTDAEFRPMWVTNPSPGELAWKKLPPYMTDELYEKLDALRDRILFSFYCVEEEKPEEKMTLDEFSVWAKNEEMLETEFPDRDKTVLDMQ